MSADNSVAPASQEERAEPRPAFSIPDDLQTRYQIRVIEGADERRVGLFLVRDPVNPALEIRDDRIVARGQDPETIESLVKLARHNGWDRIDVEGSAEFRKAIWEAATREGLTVDGYVPSFAEQERIEVARRQAGRETPREMASDAPERKGEVQGELSDVDRRLLVTLSRHLEDRKMLSATGDPDLSAFEREVQVERIELNREALEATLERALESRELEKAFRQAGFEPAALREIGQRGSGDGELADAIYRVRAGVDSRDLGTDKAPVFALDAAAAGRSTPGPGEQTQQDREGEAGLVRQERRRDEAAERRNENEELAELFLHGAADTIAADPRLANAVRAQGAMEQHIIEVFEGDVARAATANLESRQMISDVLRRGLDVSVREPAPERRLEPVQTLEMER